MLPSVHASEDSIPNYDQAAPSDIEAPISFGWLVPETAFPQQFPFVQPQEGVLSLPPAEAFARTQSVLRHLGVPAESDSQPELSYLANQQTLAGLKATLPILDPGGVTRRFINASGQGVDAFQDIDSRQVRDFSISLAPTTAEAPPASNSFHQRLLSARSNPASRPLAGLRIALDPGHMGGPIWDNRTGKLVVDGRGHKISEGVINLQVTRLLEDRFKALGAEVMITHRGLSAVTTMPYEHMDLRPFALDEFKNSTLKGWFQSLLASGSADSPKLFTAFDQSPAVKSIFAASEINHDTDFILREDLLARARAIEEFDADIAIVIHFDTNSPPDHPNGVGNGPGDATKVYVPGSYSASELGSREARMYMARHLLDATTWNASLQLGRAVVSHLHTGLKIGFDHQGGGDSRQVEPGVFSRNLVVARDVSNRALTYVECLYYNDPTEYAALLKANHPMQIDGVNVPYSDRLVQVSDSIKDGVVEFVQGYGN